MSIYIGQTRVFPRVTPLQMVGPTWTFGAYMKLKINNLNFHFCLFSFGRLRRPVWHVGMLKSATRCKFPFLEAPPLMAHHSIRLPLIAFFFSSKIRIFACIQIAFLQVGLIFIYKSTPLTACWSLQIHHKVSSFWHPIITIFSYLLRFKSSGNYKCFFTHARKEEDEIIGGRWYELSATLTSWVDFDFELLGISLSGETAFLGTKIEVIWAIWLTLTADRIIDID